MEILETEGIKRIMTVTSLNKYTNFSLNWLGMINSQLLKEAQVSVDTEILIDNLDLILKFLELMEETPLT